MFMRQENNERISQAIHYAVDMHKWQKRKGTDIPYIVHPLETMQILLEMGADSNLMIAGVLHDVLEDTDARPEDIERMFGSDVLQLVQMHSEDKSLSWRERKQHTIDSLVDGSMPYRMLVMADKVSNLRAIARDYAALGDGLWARFNQGMEQQSWYYSAVQDALYDMQFDERTAPLYWEMVALYKDVFVTYWYDESEDALYMISCHGENYVFYHDVLVWRPIHHAMPESAGCIPRYLAEQLEDIWIDQGAGAMH